MRQCIICQKQVYHDKFCFACWFIFHQGYTLDVMSGLWIPTFSPQSFEWIQCSGTGSDWVSLG